MKKACILFMLTTFFFACQQEEPVAPEPGQPLQKAEVNSSDAGLQIAKSLSLAMKDAAAREFIQSQAVRQFDGDYDILLAKARHESVTSSNARGAATFGQLLSQNEVNARTQALDLDKMLAENPLLQIAVPELPETSAESWDVENYAPIVVYRTPGVDLNEVTHLPAFDSEGNRFDFDITKIPTEPIVVVSYNERLTAVPKYKSARMVLACPVEPYYADENYNYYYTADLYCEPGYPDEPGDPSDPGDGGSGGGSTYCDRDWKGAKDELKQLRFSTIDYFRQAEHYVDGNPEVYFVITFGAKVSEEFSILRKYIPSLDRSHWKDCGVFSCDPEWYNHERNGIPLPIFDWDPKDFGDRVRYDFFEEDFSKVKQEYTAGLKTTIEIEGVGTEVSGSGKWTINAKDYPMGEDFVQYCDKARSGGTLYTTGKIYFYIGH
jgi:hypothetical protein